jgi:ankyrin repeat protein
VAALLDGGADINAVDFQAMSAINAALNASHPETAQKLLDRGADPEENRRGGVTPLMLAARHNLTTIADDLISKGVDINAADSSNGYTALSTAIETGHADMARKLIAAGAEVDVTGKEGAGPMLLACSEGHLKTIELLAEYKADLNAGDITGRNCLHYAIEEDRTVIVDFLIEQGVDLNHRNSFETTPLVRAIYLGEDDIASRLLTA